MNVDLIQTVLLSHLNDTVEVFHVAVNAAGREKSHEVESASLSLAVLHSAEDSLIIEECAVLDVLGYLDQHLVNDTSCADICMTYFGVAHLTVRQTNIKSACADDGV